MVKITDKTWQEAQEWERRFHTLPFEQGYEMYKDSYRQYFEYLDIDPDLKGKSIIEIGPADYPALAFCNNYRISYVIEPMPSSHLENLIKDKPIELIKHKAEKIEFPICDEVWLLNVLQHVQNPGEIIYKAKLSADVIRFFEPINFPTDKMHLHNFSLEFFQDLIGDCVKHYEKRTDVKNFHTWECAYGVYRT